MRNSLFTYLKQFTLFLFVISLDDGTTLGNGQVEKLRDFGTVKAKSNHSCKLSNRTIC